MQALKTIGLLLLKLARALLADDQVVAMIARDNAKLVKGGRSATVAAKAADVLRHVAETGRVVEQYSAAAAATAEKGLTVIQNGVPLRSVVTCAVECLDAWASRKKTPKKAREVVATVDRK